MKKIILSISLTFLFCSSAFADNTLHNAFIAYYSPSDVTSMVQFARQQNIGGLIMWEMKGDVESSDSHSLLGAAVQAYGNIDPQNPPTIMGYWSDWGVYGNGPYGQNKYMAKDLTNKSKNLNYIAYSFMETQPDGTLYFYDPWSDLRPTDAQDFCNIDAMHEKICWSAYKDRTDIDCKSDPASCASMGNFDDFLAIDRANNPNDNVNNPLGPIHKVVSIGGYGHDATFETLWYPNGTANDQTQQNFINSVKAIVDHYKVGIDLDYEDPNMTHEDSIAYASLVAKLSTAIGKDNISVTIMSSPEYIYGNKSGNLGFATDTLKNIAANVKHIDLMTYDFHGAFDYNAFGKTGFLTNLYHPNDAPTDYEFSVQEAVTAAINSGVPAQTITVGIPSYGRALQGIAATNHGLYQTITNSPIPRGDLDSATCSQDITKFDTNTCNGMFSYDFIVHNLLKNGFTETTWQNGVDATGNPAQNGTTAYAASWAPQASHKIEIFNSGVIGIHDITIANTDHSFGPTNMPNGSWFQPNDKGDYTTAAANINNQTGLKVTFQTYKADANNKYITYKCNGGFDFTKDMQVQINMAGDGTINCTYSPLQ